MSASCINRTVMAAPATVNEFVELTKKSQVLEDRRLEQYVHKLRAGGTLPDRKSVV